jgi:hypothetical protein
MLFDTTCGDRNFRFRKSRVLGRHSIENTETFWNKQPKSIELVYNIVPYLADFGMEYMTTGSTPQHNDIPM